MEPARGGRPALKLRMAEYRVGRDSLALPLLEISQGPGGALAFAGTAHVSGAIPARFGGEPQTADYRHL